MPSRPPARLRLRRSFRPHPQPRPLRPLKRRSRRRRRFPLGSGCTRSSTAGSGCRTRTATRITRPAATASPTRMSSIRRTAGCGWPRRGCGATDRGPSSACTDRCSTPGTVTGIGATRHNWHYAPYHGGHHGVRPAPVYAGHAGHGGVKPAPYRGGAGYHGGARPASHRGGRRISRRPEAGFTPRRCGISRRPEAGFAPRRCRISRRPEAGFAPRRLGVRRRPRRRLRLGRCPPRGPGRRICVCRARWLRWPHGTRPRSVEEGVSSSARSGLASDEGLGAVHDGPPARRQLAPRRPSRLHGACFVLVRQLRARPQLPASALPRQPRVGSVGDRIRGARCFRRAAGRTNKPSFRSDYQPPAYSVPSGAEVSHRVRSNRTP